MLNRNITVSSGIAIAVSMVIGSGLFALPSLVIESTDPITAFFSWIVIIMLMPSLIHIFSFLGQKFPSSGGIVNYAKEGFGNWSEHGFTLVICGSLLVGMPAFFMIAASFIIELLNLDKNTWISLISIVVAIISTFLNILGVDKFTIINKIVVVIILILVSILIIFSIPSYDCSLFLTKIENTNFNLNSIWLACAIVFWAFQGWENLTFGIGEFKKPEKAIKIVFWASFFIVSFIYIVFAISASFMSLSGVEITGLSGVSSILGQGIQRDIILLFIILVLIANANSWVFGASRAFYSSAKAGVLPKQLSITDKNDSPIISLISLLILYIAIILIIDKFKINIKYAFLLTTQGFIILYGASLFTYYKLTTGFKNRMILFFALFTWGFLMHGFGLLITYPIGLFLIGTLIVNYKKRKINGKMVNC